MEEVMVVMVEKDAGAHGEYPRALRGAAGGYDVKGRES